MGRIALALAVLGEVVLPIHVLPPASIAHGASWAGALLALAGLVLAILVGRAMRPVGRPWQVHARPKMLVTTGPYRVSRNPFYLALMVSFGGLMLMLSIDWVILALPLWLLVLNVWLVPHEEQHLAQVFGADWIAYAARVRRWL